MYKSSTELIENELTKELLNPVYKVFENANLIYKDFLNKSEDFFQSIYFKNISGRLISYAINRQFDSAYLTSNFPFNVNCATMAFNQKRVELRRNNILLTVSKSVDRGVLPSPSNYKRDYSAGNWGLSKQLYIDFSPYNDYKIRETPYYGIILYGVNDTELDFVDLIIPDHKYQTILSSIELKPKFTVLRTDDIKEDEERILTLKNIKKDILKDLNDVKFSANEGV